MSFRTTHGHVIDKLIENPFLTQFELMQLDQKGVSEQIVALCMVT